VTKASRQGRRQAAKTPVRAALKTHSPLQGMVKDGLGALTNTHRIHFDDSVRASLVDSLDIDEGLKQGREQENRWDYLLGHEPSQKLVGVEPHSAQNNEITTVIRKRDAARRQLQEHLRDGVFVSKWIWVASGKVHFLPMEKATLRLAEKGIQFVSQKIRLL